MRANIRIQFDNPIGKRIQPLHGMNSGPRTKSFVYDTRPQFVEAGFPYVRLHDVEYPFGSGEYVDIPCVFKNFAADENDPANYNFALTDEYIRQSLSVGAKIIYRLGISIEHAPIKRYTAPPSDYGKWARICEHIIRHYNEGWANGHRWNIEHWEIWNESDAESTKTWAGTQEQFMEFYTTAARHLKACFPTLKIGGCAFTGSRPDNVERFLEYLAAQSPAVPLDFLSFHAYSATPEKPLTLWHRFRAKLNALGYTETETMLDEWNYMGSWDKTLQPAYYPAMKDHRGAAYNAAMLCAMQNETDMTVAAYFEADVVKEFCGIFNVKEMRVSIRNAASVEPTKGFYAFKAFNSLYRMGEQVFHECDTKALWVTAAAGEIGNGALLANQETEPIELILTLEGVRSEQVIRLTDGIRTNEIVQRIPFAPTQSVKLQMPAQSILYIGTDLPDPIPTYDEDCYRNISTNPAKANPDTFF